jgi:hypothetical protein
MGAATSAPKSIQTPDVLNFILKEMFSRADLVDIYSLADPNKCSKYLIVTADALEKLFVKIQLYPTKEKDGTLYFQSISGLQKGKSPAVIALREEEKIHCKEIAFFFIRIFQTYAALTLSIMDSTIPTADPADDLPKTPGSKRVSEFIDPKTFLGVTQAAQKPKGFFSGGGVQSGGVLAPGNRNGSLAQGSFYIRDPSITDRIQRIPYSILNRVLKPPSDLQSSEDPLRFDNFSNMYIPQKGLYDFTNDIPNTRIPKKEPAPIVFYSFDRTNKRDTTYKLNAALIIDQKGENNYKITLQNFQLDDELKGNIKPKTGNLILSASDELVYKDKDDDLYKSAKGKTLGYLLQAMFEQAILDIFGEPPFSVIKYLRKLGYISSSSNQIANINGTHVYIDINTAQENSQKINIEFRDSKILEGDTTKTNIKIRAQLEIEKPTLAVGNSNSYQTKVTIDFSNKRVSPEDITDALNFPQTAVPKKFSSSTLDSIPKSDQGDLTIPQFLEKKFQTILSNQEEDVPDRSGIKYTREGLPKPHNSEEIPEDLRVMAIWKALAKNPPVKSHCIARAVQLLSVNAFQRDLGETFSSACRTTFRYQKTGDGSLPKPGESITSEHGIFALATLFIDGLENGIPKIKDTAQYKEFLRNLRFTFEKYKSLEATPGPKSLGEIEERLLPMCQEKGDSRLIIDKKAIAAGLTGRLRATVAALVARQLQHMGAAMNIIFKLFDRNSIEKQRTFALNAAMLKGGTEAVNLIAREARELLLKYYQGCELTYREGLMQIYEYDKGNKLQAQTIISRNAPEPTPTVPTTGGGSVWR